jgi:hypothetical protein
MSNMMNNMMANPMMQQMMSNPDMMKQAQAMMSGGQGGFDPSSMQSMMSNPSMTGLLKNPDMLKMALNMLKDPNNKGMAEMFGAQNSNVNMGMLVKALEVVVSLATTYKKVKSVYDNKFVKLFLFALVILLVAYYFS